MLTNNYRVLSLFACCPLSTCILILPPHFSSLPNHTKESTIFNLDACPLTPYVVLMSEMPEQDKDATKLVGIR